MLGRQRRWRSVSRSGRASKPKVWQRFHFIARKGWTRSDPSGAGGVRAKAWRVVGGREELQLLLEESRAVGVAEIDIS